jgi:hypothetical protein
MIAHPFKAPNSGCGHVSHTTWWAMACITTRTILTKSLMGKVGAPGFEPGTFGSQNRRATKLRYAPIGSNVPVG